MDLNLGENWVLEYSEKEGEEGRYPYHITTRVSSENYGPGYSHWKVIFRGACEECNEEHQRLLDTYPERVKKYMEKFGESW